MNNPLFFHKMIATGFGSGYSPVAPGTAGALLATLLWWVMSVFLSPGVLGMAVVGLIVVFTLVGVWSAGVMETVWGNDPSRVVVDEMVGVWIPLAIVGRGEILYMLLAFAAFRLFDIFKPLGIRRMENIRGGWGIMLDDILAGIYSLLIIIVLKIIVLKWLVG